MHRTPWTKLSSSLPSDRIKPKPSPIANSAAKVKGKSKGQQQPDDEPPKSKAVRRLEKLLSGLRKARMDERDAKGGCFCLARTHELSPYTPLCHSCGLILCALNPPYLACPHCTQPLLSSSSSQTPTTSSRLTTRETLITRIEAEFELTLAAEQTQREQAVKQARQEAGAFPMLHAGVGSASPSPLPGARMLTASAPPSRNTQAQPQSQTHKVMSLTSKAGNSRRVVVSSYTTTPVTSRPSSRNANPSSVDDLEDGLAPRVPAPAPPTLELRASSERPWQNLIHGAATYKPPTRLDDNEPAGGSSSRRRRGNKNKAKDREPAVS